MDESVAFASPLSALAILSLPFQLASPARRGKRRDCGSGFLSAAGEDEVEAWESMDARMDCGAIPRSEDLVQGRDSGEGVVD